MKEINKWADGEWLFILIAIAILGWWIYSSQGTNVEKYLSQNAAVMSIDRNKWDDLSLLDQDLEGKEIILTGETPGVKANKEVELKILHYLQKKTPLKYYLGEVSYVEAKYINQYLATGDKAVLESLYKPGKEMDATTEESYERWEALYEYNQHLDPAKRLEVVGIDIEHQIDLATWYLGQLLPDIEAPSQIEETVRLICEVNELSEESAQRVFQDIVENRSIYKDYLSESYFDFEMVSRNIVSTYDVRQEGNRSKDLRSGYMYENFKSIYETLPQGVYYGQWDLNHVFQSEQNGMNWLASQLNKLDFKDKILSIAYVYEDAQVVDKEGGGRYGKKYFSSLSDNYNLRAGLPQDESLLLRLIGEDSPFDRKLIWPISYYAGGDTPIKGVTTDYFQYLMIIRGSQVTQSLKQ